MSENIRIIDPEKVLERIGGDTERLRELYEIALEEIPRWKRDLRALLNRRAGQRRRCGKVRLASKVCLRHNSECCVRDSVLRY
jgi:hypothetical protein